MKSAKLSGALILIALAAVGCSSAKKEKPYQPTPVAKAIYESTEVPHAVSVETKGTDQVDFASIEFDRGEAKLSEADRRHLAHRHRHICGPSANRFPLRQRLFAISLP